MGLLEDVINDSIRFLSNRGYQEALSNAVSNSETRFFNMLRQHGNIKELAKEVEEAKKEVLSNVEYYIDKVMDSFKAANGVAHYAESGKDALEIIDKIIGDRKRILLSKSMTCEE
ncbi:MAG: lactate utilization protein, partial [Caldisphaeraceae archaeon]|nr:lactate utilization protein [Caldisphaeraceae archaeon]